MFRRGLASVALAFAVAVTGTGCKQTSDQPTQHPVDSAVMEYCRGDANKAPEKAEQLQFLREHEVTVTSGVLDYKVVTTDSYTAYVRYYAGDDQPTRRCLFGVEEPAKQMTSIIQYIQGDKTFVPPSDKVCLSARPPTITTGLTVVRLECDHLLPR